MKRCFLAAAVFLGTLLAVSCNSNRAQIRGTIEGAEGETAYLVDLSSGVAVDSIVVAQNGEFDFRVELPEGESVLYNVKVGDNGYTIFPSAGERVRLSAIFGEREYEVSGSRESELVHEVNCIMQGGIARMDAIAKEMREETTDQIAQRAYVAEYLTTKRSQIRFIVENCHSLAAIYALYQRLPGDATLFNGENDVVYYRMVADSVALAYPTSPYLKTLRNIVSEVDSRYDMISKLEESYANPVSHPDIELKDMYGRTQTLDGNMGRATLLVFTAMLAEGSSVFNAELKRLYEEYSTLGLSIYQVSLDGDRTLWLNAVQEQRLPWTSVIDIRGAEAPAAKLYNVTALPTMYLLDRDGEIVGHNLSGEELVRKLNDIL